MGFIKRLMSAPKAEKAFSQALDIYQSLRRFPVKSPQYHEALLTIVSLCQEAITSNERHGDARVLLANTYYLLHVDTFPDTGNDLPLKLAAATIQHWSDEPMRQYPWTKNVDNGHRIHDMVRTALSAIKPDLRHREEQAMRTLKTQLYSEAVAIESID